MKYGNLIVPTDEMREILKLCVKWYGMEGNCCGGELHVVLDDDNVDDGCINHSLEKSTNKDAVEILNRMKSLPEYQRMWITYNIYNVKDGNGEREIYEEIEE